ncbi:MAG TPA: response regulator [Kiritimatiellia bacterium]|nr:response regulator [Kiritimatiellia bacterium]HMP00060.1 response regulator [Kiritimatiellia bacterium]HMP96535.1 response regulator [Kiritimatiellia bacterium]
MILVVDDDHAITQILHDLLKQDGYDVRSAANGEAAYALIRQVPCEGILLDMMMPGINGAGFLMLLASEAVSVPVVVMTGNPDYSEDEVREFPNVVGFLKKPFYPEEAVSLVRRFMAPPKA